MDKGRWASLLGSLVASYSATVRALHTASPKPVDNGLEKITGQKMPPPLSKIAMSYLRVLCMYELARCPECVSQGVVWCTLPYGRRRRKKIYVAAAGAAFGLLSKASTR